jgi:hypothetical protein
VSKEFCHHLFEARAVVQQCCCVQQCADSSLEKGKKREKMGEQNICCMNVVIEAWKWKSQR